MTEHARKWVKSPLLAYVATQHDGPNFRYVRLGICSECGVLGTDTKFAGAETYEDYKWPVAQRSEP